MRRKASIFSSGLGAIALVLGMTLPAQAFTPTQAIRECSQTKVKPRRFTIVQPCWVDSGIYARKSTWRYWDRKLVTGRWAKAATEIFIDNCVPDCARGHFHHRPAHVWLTARGWCRKAHTYVYRAQYIRYVGPEKGTGPNIGRWPHGWHWLGCPRSP